MRTADLGSSSLGALQALNQILLADLAKKGIMKTIKLNIKNASAGQMLTLRGELRVMAASWKKFGPVIEVQAGKLKETEYTSHKRSITKW